MKILDWIFPTESFTETYKLPLYINRKLGSIPKDSFEETDQPKYDGGFVKEIPCPAEGGCDLGSEPVTATIPIMQNGAPLMKEVTETLSARPYSPLRAILTGIVGAAITGGTALALSHLPKLPMAQYTLPAAVALSGLFTGLVGLISAAGDHLTVQQEPHDVIDTKLLGYTYVVSEKGHCHPGAGAKAVPRGDCPEYVIEGYQHQYTPNLERKKVGEYKFPVLVHKNLVTTKTALKYSAVWGMVIGLGAALLPLLSKIATAATPGTDPPKPT